MNSELGYTFIVGEIGINWNGDRNLLERLIRGVHWAGADSVKFQTRTIDRVFTKEELIKPKKTPWPQINTYREYKERLELKEEDYYFVADLCRELNLDWHSSPWDEDSVDRLVKYDLTYLKIASACLTDKALLKKCAKTGLELLLSTGMSSLDQVKRAVDVIYEEGGRLACIYHCNSTYPTPVEECNLLGIRTLKKEFPDIPIGVSQHDTKVSTSIMAVVLGAEFVERHITLDRAGFGSDQAASLELRGFKKVVDDIRLWEVAKGTGMKQVYDSEVPIMKKLRRYNTL